MTMCAIAGVIKLTQPFEPGPWVDGMLATMQRRGPDQQGVLPLERGILLHARLAVIDPEGGRQPMTWREGEASFSIVYNGELYNSGELRGELEKLGWQFRTHCDTEVMLYAFIQWGEDCLRRSNGIFAFAVWDHRQQKLFLARDRMGVKPLFFTLRQDTLIFGSEIKTLLAHPLVPARLNQDGVAEIMLVGPGRTPGCGVFQGIEEVRPGCCGWFNEKGLQLHPYWQLKAHPHTESFAETAAHVRYLLVDAIRRQLVSDVPVGTFLSGGLDSSLISSVACDAMAADGRQLHTFSLDYRDNDRYFQPGKFQPNSDTGYIRQMQDFLPAEHHWTVLDTPQLVEGLFEAVEARDLPGMADVDASLLLFCREIRQSVTVALSGECADEIFGGYPWYRDPEIRQQAGFPWAQTSDWRFSFLKEELAQGIDPAAFMNSRCEATLRQTDYLPEDTSEERRMREMTRLNLDWFMQTLLDRKDRMSMYSGLEVRVPFCDWRIVEYLYSVPWAYKDHRQTEKGLLREAMSGWLPEEILWRKKSPYPKTHHPAYRRAVSDRLREIMADPSAPLMQLVRREMLEKLLVSESSVPWYGQLMTAPQTIAYFLQLNYWLEHYHVTLC